MVSWNALPKSPLSCDFLSGTLLLRVYPLQDVAAHMYNFAKFITVFSATLVAVLPSNRIDLVLGSWLLYSKQPPCLGLT